LGAASQPILPNKKHSVIAAKDHLPLGPVNKTLTEKILEKPHLNLPLNASKYIKVGRKDAW